METCRPISDCGKAQPMTLTVGSLFSGIGGLDLGLERAGMKVIWQSEIDPYASQVLKKHWSEVPNHGNIKNIDWATVERPTVICGGYPCQPFSQAGHRKGEKDSRHLFPWVFEAISTLRPDYCILENVRGHLSLGAASVIGNLASIGYRSEWRVISAASVGAHHRRDRIVIVSYPDSGNTPDGRECAPIQGKSGSWADDSRRSNTNTREICVGCSRQNTREISHPYCERCMDIKSEIFTDKRRLETLSDFTSSCGWAVEPGIRRVADGIPNRVDRLKCLGNAVVPQVAEVVGRLVMHHAQAI